MDRNVEPRFSKFLIGYKVHEHETREFQRAAGRLVATNITKESSGSGPGVSVEVIEKLGLALPVVSCIAC